MGELISRRAVLWAMAAAAPDHGVVLVHGAWHGSWCWARVVELLAARGVKASAPCLTGVGERVKEVSASTTLATHVDDVVKACAAFSRVTLVGHSYAGLVITPACDALAEKLDALVYLDAFLPANGQSGFDLMKKSFGDHWRERAKGGLLVPPMLSAKSMGVDDPKVDAKLTGHPLATMEAKVTFDEAKWSKVKKRYLRCNRYAGFGPTAARAKTLGFEVEELDCGHDAMLAAPEALVDALLRG
jgi:pimeloyl-ACP methyl ester carboxylesterase